MSSSRRQASSFFKTLPGGPVIPAPPSLESKLHELKVGTDVTPEDTKRRSVDEAQKLLNEIKDLNTGAFAGFWGNPVVGALLFPSGGMALIELITSYLKNR
ncbi:MAG: hypothetical protein JWQ04_3535 [Pedosphaera sp.]|nr:hypothetical protein [Pedosphaera sp.]